MGKINVSRVVLGGLLAGLVVNVAEVVLNLGLLAEANAEAMANLGLHEPAGAQVAAFVAVGFALGIVLVWLYAAMRPRFGPGPATAVRAGLAGWFLVSGVPSVFFYVSGMFPPALILTAVVWALVETPLATVVGAWFYQEE